MPDFLDRLVEDAKVRIRAGYYDTRESAAHKPVSLKSAMKSATNNAIIAEIKPVSPALGPLRLILDPVDAATKLAKGGAIALSVLTEPDNFGGSLSNLLQIRRHVSIPLLMKDIIVDKSQIKAGARGGADCVLLIESAFSRQPANSLSKIIDIAHNYQLEVLLEVHNKDELDRALKSRADIIGVNNRNLETLETDLGTTAKVMSAVHDRAGKLIISESGFAKAEDIRQIKSMAVDGFLIGSSIMLSQDLESKVREFVLA
jgi:indole-3-glycerol phosphate synthase